MEIPTESIKSFALCILLMSFVCVRVTHFVLPAFLVETSVEC